MWKTKAFYLHSFLSLLLIFSLFLLIHTSEVCRDGERKDSDEAHRERHKQASYLLQAPQWVAEEGL